MDEQETNTGPSAEVIAEAREMGWRPKEEFQGDPEHWVDADAYVEKGRHVMPILKATNERLRGDLTKTNTELADLRRALANSQSTIEALERYHQDDVKQKVEKARADLKAQLVAAKKDGNVEAEVDLTDQLTQLNDAERLDADRRAAAGGDDKDKGTRRDAPVDLSKDPIYLQWKDDNPWFGTDDDKTAIANDVSIKLRLAGNTKTGRAFLDDVALETSRRIERLSGGRTAKVEAGRGGAGGTTGAGTGAKTYNDLPSDAKRACDDFARDLVGPGRRYKDVDSWRKSYVEQYFREV